MIEIDSYCVSEFKTYQISPYLPFSTDYTVLCGGALRSLFKKQNVDDFDVFILADTQEELSVKIDNIRDRMKQLRARLIFECPKGELFSYRLHGYKFQIINVGHLLHKSIEGILDSFDFHICQMAYHKGIYYFSKEAIRSQRTKKLTLNKITYPAATIRRLEKYRKRGFDTYQCTMDVTQRIIDMVKNGENLDSSTIYVD